MSGLGFINGLAQELASDGWSEISCNFDLDGVYTFDLHAVKNIWKGASVLQIFVTRCPAYLDNAKLQEYLGLYEIVKKKYLWSLIQGRIHFLCLLSEEGVASEAASLVDRYAPSPLGYMRGSALFLCLVDLRNLVAYLKVPVLPVGHNKACGSVLVRIYKAFSLMRAAPPPVQQPPAAYSCPTCGNTLTFIEQYQRWYCYKCQKYA